MSTTPAIFVENVYKDFWVHARTDATILSRIADAFPSGGKRLHSRKIEAVRNVSFALDRGKVLGIIGKNAAGKSTLLRLIANIYEPDAGTVIVDGTITSLISLSVGLRPTLSIIDNIYLACSLFGMPRSHIKKVYPQILEFAGITDACMYPYQLSTGMNQRLSFSIAVHTKPEILLLDEIFSAGDIAFQSKAQQRMEELIKGDTTVVMVSHSIERIRELSDVVLWLEAGSVKMIGEPKEVIHAYIVSMQRELIAK
ncbi:hypothetical protein COU75_03505 [Candidatus Peregrinibacteria bacterium CG10_big_fil_rev_8_21_14_0_10_42_8]|nr:MAG: hypothetical protein COU75_03505 [Candidatus Peregrinibacteria bacterium CG10_big_fil_rev_8_21_14_0_10_42_8]